MCSQDWSLRCELQLVWWNTWGGCVFVLFKALCQDCLSESNLTINQKNSCQCEAPWNRAADYLASPWLSVSQLVDPELFAALKMTHEAPSSSDWDKQLLLIMLLWLLLEYFCGQSQTLWFIGGSDVVVLSEVFLKWMDVTVRVTGQL